jgi:RNA ligase (TIGR02306 family)
MRKLVTIRKVQEIKHIEGADAIELALVDGWQVVVKKGEFAAGDSGAYFEIDSFLPAADPRFAFLAKGGFKVIDGVEGVRLRSIRLRGALSQGLLLRLTDFPELSSEGVDLEDIDLAERLKVTKYEPPLPAQLSGQVRGPFPGRIQKTDQERIQNLPELLNLRDQVWEVTEKLDGSSMTAYRNDEDFGVCSRNLSLKESDENTLWQIVRKYQIEEILAALGVNLALQGEVAGEGIQGNKYKLRGQEWFIFDIWDIDAGRYLGLEERQSVLGRIQARLPDGMRLRTVPVVEVASFTQLGIHTIEDILKYAEGKSALGAGDREGVVFKAVDGKTSFKVISNRFLLKYGE